MPEHEPSLLWTHVRVVRTQSEAATEASPSLSSQGVVLLLCWSIHAKFTHEGSALLKDPCWGGLRGGLEAPGVGARPPARGHWGSEAGLLGVEASPVLFCFITQLSSVLRPCCSRSALLGQGCLSCSMLLAKLQQELLYFFAVPGSLLRVCHLSPTANRSAWVCQKQGSMLNPGSSAPHQVCMQHAVRCSLPYQMLEL